MTATIAFERLFFAVFGQTSPDDINSLRHTRPEWTEILFKLVYGIYMLVSVIVLINLLIAMMSDTYQRIQVMKFECFCIFPWKSSFISLHITVKNPKIVRLNLIHSFELLFFAVFGQTSTDQTIADKIATPPEVTQPKWTEILFKLVFGIYLLVSVIVLINLLIAMMSDTYQRIQVFRKNIFIFLGEILDEFI